MSLVPTQVNYPVPAQYPASAPQPQWFQAVVSVMISLIMLSVFVAWGVSQIRKVFKGEEVEMPLS